MEFESRNTLVTALGECRIPSPVSKRGQGTNSISFVSDQDRILIDVNVNRACRQLAEGPTPPSYELAGPRRHIFFDPSKLKCAIVMCGGLCPGLNDLIRSIILELHYGYGVRNIFGVRYGLRGFIPRYGYDFVDDRRLLGLLDSVLPDVRVGALVPPRFIDRTPVSDAVTSWLGAVGLPWSFTFDVEHVTVINAGTIILLQVLVSRIVKQWPALPTMVTGMAFGAIGFALLALSQNPWVFILGIAVFSIGEMTAHPKYYSFVGLVAPSDRKAVYMGYAFLYGVFGSLLGSSIGAFLYERVMKPVDGTPDAPETARMFWLLFAALDVIAASGLVMFAKVFGPDTPSTRRHALVVMRGVYAAILLLGLGFLYTALSATPIQARVVVQALIFVTLGAGGLVYSRAAPEVSQ